MATSPLHARLILPRLIDALKDTPVVLVHGPRQCGKTTLARLVGDAAGYTYLDLDDEVRRASARADPMGFIDDLPKKVVLDEIQRVPELFTSIKAAVDRDRMPGRFILTGSANVLLLPRLSDSLAGRLEVLRLHPLAQAELVPKTRSSQGSPFLTALFDNGFRTGSRPRMGRELIERVVAGGYPAALARPSASRRASWYREYIDALMQRDVRDLARISALDAMPRLLTLAAGQTARLVNVADLASPFHLSRPTIHNYIELLARVFLLEYLPPWHTNRISRLIKSPKLHLGDTGVACALLNVNTDALIADRTLFGQLLETFIFQELRRQASWLDSRISFHHFRDKDGAEVDMVIEHSGQQIAGIEIKAAATVTNADFRGLNKLKELAGKRFKAGVILYDGEATAPFGENLYAVPIRRLWEKL